jgi:galactokinase
LKANNLSPHPIQPQRPAPSRPLSRDLLQLDPTAGLLSRAKKELSAEFDFNKPIRFSRAPGRLDVMGGIADYTGSLVCELTLDRAAAVMLQDRNDREIQIFSFNLFDEHHPFTFRMPLAGLAKSTSEELQKEFAAPGRKWAGYIAGCLFVLHERKLIDLAKINGLNLALLSTVPLGAGVSSSAAIEVATMMNLIEHFNLRAKIDPMHLAEMCQSVENRIVCAPCGIMDQVTSCYGEAGAFLRMVCQPHELQAPLFLPAGFRVVGINSNVKHSVGGGMYGKTRCAAFMGHSMILAKMREMGKSSGKELSGDPMRGYLANLDPDDYKKFFRPNLPLKMRGDEFLSQFGPTIDKATRVDPNVEYHVQQATDHHVLEARRVKQFCEFVQQAGALAPGDEKRFIMMDKAGHLMYASHLSYTNDAMLGADECDLLVDLARHRAKKGIYGAKITGGGSGGTVAILCEINDRADAAIAEIMREYESKTGHKPEAFLGSSPGAWHVGTAMINP